MFRSWFGNSDDSARNTPRRTSRRKNRPTREVRLRLEWMEDRTLPSATSYLVIAPQTARAGQASYVEVIALDPANQRARDYTGTASITSSDTSATLSATSLTFRRGVAVFAVTPSTSETETLTVTDTSNSAITGTASFQVDPAAVATQFLVRTRPADYAGQQTTLVVAAVDSSGRLVTNYTGTVQISSSDSAAKSGSAALPTTYTFTTNDRGVHVFQVTPNTTGSQTFTATDQSNSSLTGSATVQVTAAPAVSRLLVVAPRNAEPGQQTRVLVVALDASNRPVPTYTGTVQVTSSDTTATSSGNALPARFTFTAADHGLHFFPITFGATTTGSQTVTATDTTTASITGSVTVQVATTSGTGFPGGRFTASDQGPPSFTGSSGSQSGQGLGTNALNGITGLGQFGVPGGQGGQSGPGGGQSGGPGGGPGGPGGFAITFGATGLGSQLGSGSGTNNSSNALDRLFTQFPRFF